VRFCPPRRRSSTSLSYNSATDVFTSVVKNQGTTATRAGVFVGVSYSVDGAYCTWGGVNGPLAAGASVTIGSDGGPCTIASGTHTITAFADDVDRMVELDKTNNKLSQTITVSGSGQLPDLVPTTLSYDVPSGNFTSVISNQGAGPTPAGVFIGVSYSVDGVYRTWGGVNGPLAAGASVTIGSAGGGGPYTIAPGTHTITVVADDVDRIVMSTRANDTLSETITVSGSGPLPDLIPTSLSYNSATGLFTSVVKNQGTAATPTGVVIGVAYSVDGAKCTWGYVGGPLAAGASVTIGTGGGTCTIASGTHTITVFADDVNRIAESNKNNNMLSETITVP
jgi:subtilase family serine protease